MRASLHENAQPPLLYHFWTGVDPPPPPPDPDPLPLPPLPDPQGSGERNRARGQKGEGLILGRFVPPHLGHDHLIATAKAQVERLTAVVASRVDDPIDARRRASWLRQMHPDVTVAVMPADALPSLQTRHSFWRSLRDAVSLVLKDRPVDVVFASEYGARGLADALSARFVLVDPQRRVVPISATMIRQDPLAHWDYLPGCVRAHYVRRICLLGPEGSAKSTLARQLADHFGTRYVEEYARRYAAQHSQELSVADFEIIARQQAMIEQAERQSANKLLFCDTDVLSLALWCERLHGESPPWLFEAARLREDTLYLLCEPDLPYQRGDGFGDQHARRRFVKRCREEVEGRWPHAHVRGRGEVRFERAVEAVHRLLGAPRPSRSRRQPVCAIASSPQERP